MWLFMISGKSQAMSAADSAESSRMLGLAYQGQGQLDAAFEKYRRCLPEENTYNLIYNLGLDYKRKRQYNKAQSCYEFIGETESGFRDIQKRIPRCSSMGDAVLMGGNTM
jgi:serine/threonine-protein kinase